MNSTDKQAKRVLSAAWWWLLLALLLLAVALANPTWRLPKLTYDYLFVIDITQSMNTLDMEVGENTVRRLDYAKVAAIAALEGLPCGSNVGVLIFTANRTFVMFSPVEVCEHHEAITAMLKKIDWQMAWYSRSEVTKGMYSALDAARAISPNTRLVFFTDGHESPPLHQSIRPPFDEEADVVGGIIAGIGGLIPARIPHLSKDGRIVGYWAKDEVMQVDVYSVGRGGTTTGEPMVGVNMANVARRIALGQEHLSALRQDHLRDLGAQTGLSYQRVDTFENFAASLREEQHGRRVPAVATVAWLPAALAFVSLLIVFAWLPWRANRAFNARDLPHRE